MSRACFVVLLSGLFITICTVSLTGRSVMLSVHEFPSNLAPDLAVKDGAIAHRLVVAIADPTLAQQIGSFRRRGFSPRNGWNLIFHHRIAFRSKKEPGIFLTEILTK